MKYDGTNLEEVIAAHQRWLENEENDEDKADFSNADLSYLNLSFNDFYGADFTKADFYHAIIDSCNFRRAIFTNACGLDNAIISFCDFRDAIDMPKIPALCPDEGSFIAWKKAIYKSSDGTIGDPVIVKLLIPEDAQRVSTTEGCCRSDKAFVLEIQKEDGTPIITEANKHEGCAISMKRKAFEYRVGEMSVADEFEADPWKYLGNGIHYFINRYRAVKYPVFSMLNIEEPEKYNNQLGNDKLVSSGKMIYEWFHGPNKIVKEENE